MARRRANEDDLDDDELPLLSLAELYIIVAFGEAECHGYAIMQLVESDSRGALRLRPSTVYAAIKRMLESGYLEEVQRVVQCDPRRSNGRQRDGRQRDDTRRRYYALTPFGQIVANLQLQLLESLLKRARARQVLRDLCDARARAGK
jgi:DNA-binding PadR family transcriptional regulator